MVQVFRYAGFGAETTFGTAVTPTFYIACTGNTMDTPAGVENIIPDGLGRSDRTSRPAYYVPKGSLDYHPDFISLTSLLKWAVSGGYVFTAAEAPATINTHEIYGNNSNEPEFFTLYTGKDVFEHQFTSTVINSLSLSVSNNLAKVKVDLLSQKDIADTIQTEADLTTLVSGTKLSYQDATCSINGTDKSTYVKSFDLGIANNISAESGQSIGSRYPRRFRSGKRAVTFNIQLLFEDLDALTLYWGGATGVVDAGSTKFALKPKFTIGTESIEYNMPNVAINSITTQPAGSDTLIQTMSGSAFLKSGVALADATTVSTDLLITALNTGATLAA